MSFDIFYNLIVHFSYSSSCSVLIIPRLINRSLFHSLTAPGIVVLVRSPEKCRLSEIPREIIRMIKFAIDPDTHLKP